MNKFLRPGFWLLPALFLLAIVTFFNLTGCRGGSGGPSLINMDSVKPHIIPLSLAIDYAARFRAINDTFDKKCPGFADDMQFGHSEAFNKSVYQLLLEQKDSNGVKAAGIRIYYGLGKEGQVKLILVPYDTSGKDILHRLDVSTDEKQVPGVSPIHTESLIVSDAQAAEVGQHCPPVCPPGSPLDSFKLK